MEIENWENTGNSLMRELTFDNQTELAEFLLQVAKYSDEVDHHADMEIVQCSKLKLTITTHDAGKLTAKDFSWAREFNNRFN